MAGMLICKPGTFDDRELLDKLPVVQEIYTRNRPSCIEAFKEAKQVEGAS